MGIPSVFSAVKCVSGVNNFRFVGSHEVRFDRLLPGSMAGSQPSNSPGILWMAFGGVPSFNTQLGVGKHLGKTVCTNREGWDLQPRTMSRAWDV